MRLPNLHRHLGRTPAPNLPPPEEQAPFASREQRLTERFLEDEALRGDLDDDTWQPIQDWLVRAAALLAASTAGLDDASATLALDRGQATLRHMVGTLVHALSASASSPEFGVRLEPLHRAVQPPFIARADKRRVQAVLRSAARQLTQERADPATAAARLVTALEP